MSPADRFSGKSVEDVAMELGATEFVDIDEPKMNGDGRKHGTAWTFKVPSRAELTPTVEEIETARTAPRCIIENYLYSDVCQLAAAGGTGKTTIVLYEDMCVALSRDLWGLKVINSGWTLFITSEDQKEFLLGRRREIVKAMGFTDEEKATIRRDCLIWDVTGEQLKLIQARDGNIVLTGLVDAIIAAYKDDPPAVITFDPLVSFGCSESQVNDNEQGLIEAARRLNRKLDCMVRYVHHVGKANARNRTTDQYSGRNGSALPDGSRMTFIMTPAEPKKEGQTAEDHHLPANVTLEDGETAVLLNRAKLSFVKKQPKLYIIRNGYAFRHVSEDPRTADEIESAKMDQVVNWLRDQANQGIFVSRSDFIKSFREPFGLPRDKLDALVGRMIATGRLSQPPHPQPHGRRTTCLSADPISRKVG